MSSQVPRAAAAAAAGDRGWGAVPRGVCVKKRTGCGASAQRAREACHPAASAGGMGPCHQNQSGVGAWGGHGTLRRLEVERLSVPRPRSRAWRVARVAGLCGTACTRRRGLAHRRVRAADQGWSTPRLARAKSWAQPRRLWRQAAAQGARLPPRPAWPARLGLGGRIGGEAAARASAPQEADGQSTQGQAEVDGSIAGVEREDRQ